MNAIEQTMTVTKCACLRCGYAWWPRGAYIPVMCPRCKSKIWMKPKKDLNGDVDQVG